MADFWKEVDDIFFAPGRKAFSWITGNGWSDPNAPVDPEDLTYFYAPMDPEAVKNYYASSSPDKSVEDNLGDSVANENNTSADKSAQSANQQTADWFKQAMKYNEKQAQINREFQQSSAEKAMKFEAEEAKKLRDWQETLSNSQYQRAVADLRKAGLNPMLVAQYVSGASTPSGSSASGISASGSSASISQTSAAKAEVDLNSRARIIEAYLRSETELDVASIQSVSKLLSALIGLAG